MKKLIVSLALLVGFGCSANQDKAKAHQENLEDVKVLSTFMKDNNLTGSIHVTISGDGSVYAKEAFGMDTGINIQANIQFTPALSSPTELVPPK
jgi:uncharacterized protein YcfL